MDHDTSKVILFLNSSLVNGKNKEYLIAVFKHKKRKSNAGVRMAYRPYGRPTLAIAARLVSFAII